MTKKITDTRTPEERILDGFKDAYKKLFGVQPTIKQVGDFYRVQGYPDGMSVKRLKQLTANLNQRAREL